MPNIKSVQLMIAVSYRNSIGLTENLHTCLRYAPTFQIGAFCCRAKLFLCEGDGGFTNQLIPVRYRHETMLLVENRFFLNYDRTLGNPDNSYIFRTL